MLILMTMSAFEPNLVERIMTTYMIANENEDDLLIGLVKF